MSSSIPVLPTISTACIVISAVLVAFGVWQIKKKNRETHQKLMFWAAVFAVVFFIIYASRTIFIGNTAFGGPDSLKIYYTIFFIECIDKSDLVGYNTTKYKRWGKNEFT